MPVRKQSVQLLEVLVARVAFPQSLLPSKVKLPLGDLRATQAGLGYQVAKVLQEHLGELDSGVDKVIVLATKEVLDDRQQRLASIKVQRGPQALLHDGAGKVAEGGVVLRRAQDGAQADQVPADPEFLQPADLVQPSLQDAHHLRVLRGQDGDLLVQGPRRHGGGPRATGRGEGRGGGCRPLGRAPPGGPALRGAGAKVGGGLRQRLREASPSCRRERTAGLSPRSRGPAAAADSAAAIGGLADGSLRGPTGRLQQLGVRHRAGPRVEPAITTSASRAPGRGNLSPLQVRNPEAELRAIGSYGKQLLLWEA
mmetsp:Transcript_54133/g.150188  ORF Transcript_54133/g.150188 Transcript_54133/m.150188 type:complete len:311 (-) Transcript_54133:878-1810(-)